MRDDRRRRNEVVPAEPLGAATTRPCVKQDRGWPSGRPRSSVFASEPFSPQPWWQAHSRSPSSRRSFCGVAGSIRQTRSQLLRSRSPTVARVSLWPAGRWPGRSPIVYGGPPDQYDLGRRNRVRTTSVIAFGKIRANRAARPPPHPASCEEKRPGASRADRRGPARWRWSLAYPRAVRRPIPAPIDRLSPARREPGGRPLLRRPP